MPFNSHQFGVKQFDAGFANNTVYSMDSVSFQNTSLNDGTNIVLTKPPLAGPSRELLTAPTARGEGQFQNYQYFRLYTVVLEGYLKAASASAMATAMDNLRRLLATPQGNLDITDDNGVVKRFKATCVNYEEMFSGRQRYHVTLVPFSIKLVASLPFGRSRDYVSTSLPVTTSPTVQAVVHAGSATAKPVVTLNFSSASSVTGAGVTNATTGDSITYTGTLSAGDVLVFDSENLRVLLNGAVVAYSGGFPTLVAGANLVSIAITGSSFLAYTTVAHKSTWL
jgi:uncharacterized Zn-binding protein involved in type VI secretion